jgi:ABC-type ATPase with predicted acetyltransferase domain
MGTWKCTKCGYSTWSNNKPLVIGCPRGGHHHWVSYDGKTPVIWRCGKCGMSTLSANRPLDRSCPRGGKCSWQKQH